MRPSGAASSIAAALIACAACGHEGPKLTNLRCRAATCQNVENPFRLELAVDFQDPTGTLGAGELDLRVDGSTQTAIALRDLFTFQAVALDAKSGTLQIDDDVLLSRIKDGTTFQLSLLATNGKGQDSNEPSLRFTIKLGSPP